MVILRRIFVPLIVIHVSFALWSGYRAIVQVFRLDLDVASSVLHDGSTIAFAVVSSGRVPVTVRLEMIQGSTAETLAVERVRTSRNPAYDPRTKRASRTVVLSPDLLARFSGGQAFVRVTALGGSQWLRTPPPTVREAVVTIQR